jgi:hypothetical protein
MPKLTKGQSSLEYLMIYGISIAIVVIAVAALYSLGVFSNHPKIQNETIIQECNSVCQSLNFSGSLDASNYNNDIFCSCSMNITINGTTWQQYDPPVIRFRSKG